MQEYGVSSMVSQIGKIVRIYFIIVYIAKANILLVFAATQNDYHIRYSKKSLSRGLATKHRGFEMQDRRHQNSKARVSVSSKN